jgi:hypothetical protein
MINIDPIDPNAVLTRAEKEELILDLYFNQNKTVREIAKVAKASFRDIGEIKKRENNINPYLCKPTIYFGRVTSHWMLPSC